MSETFTLYKLIVLFMLQKVDFPLTNAQISDFILEKGYTTYFTLQQAIGEMIEANLIRLESTHNRSLYHLTEEGEETIQFFQNKISPAIQNDILLFLKERQYDLKEETSIKADYYRNTSHEYSVRCQIQENGLSLIDLTLTVPSEVEAESIVNNWNRKNQELYALIMQNLL
ncbi:DUF4364 family protein [Lachnospiraceae bacterium LCP25S3_G4]